MAGYIGSKSSVTLVDGITKNGGTLEGDLSFGDNDKAKFGAGDDLQIYHDGSHSRITDAGTGSLLIDGDEVYVRSSTGENKIIADTNGGVNLFYDNASKLATTTTGIAVTGSTAHTAGDITNTISGTYNLNGANGTAGSAAYVTYSFKDDVNTGMYRGGADTLSFATGGSQRMRITSSGLLEASHDAYDGMQRSLTLSNPRNSAGTGDGTSIYFNNTGTTTIARSAYIGGVSEGNYGQSNALVFGVSNGGSSPTERMRINSQGFVGIDCSPTYRLDVDSGGSVAAARLRRNTDGSLRTVLLFLSRSNSNTVGSISISNSATAYNTSSDYRLKENVVDLTGASARVNQLNPSRFNFIADDTNTLVDGFLAHEVADVVPEAITGTKDAMKDEEYEVTPAVEATYDEDGNELTAAVEAVMGTRSVPDYQGIDQSKLVPLLTAALQEALAEITSLKTRVQALEDV